MKRESHDRVERRLQELKDKRNDTKERARRNARRLSDNRDRDVRKAKLFLDGIEEQQKVFLNLVFINTSCMIRILLFYYVC